MNEFTGKGIAKNQTIGWLLLMALGTAGAPTLAETGVYTHAFSMKNDNNHPAATIARVASTMQQSSYNMLDSLSMIFQVGQQVKFEVKTM
jgi:hypothetical protein